MTGTRWVLEPRSNELLSRSNFNHAKWPESVPREGLNDRVALIPGKPMINDLPRGATSNILVINSALPIRSMPGDSLISTPSTSHWRTNWAPDRYMPLNRTCSLGNGPNGSERGSFHGFSKSSFPGFSNTNPGTNSVVNITSPIAGGSLPGT